MKKVFELISIRGKSGSYTAVLYNRFGGYYTEKHFLWYSKKKKCLLYCVTSMIALSPVDFEKEGSIMTYNCIYRNGKIERFFIKIDRPNEFEFIRPYYLVTSFDHPRKGRIYEMECLFGGLVWQGRQGHGYGYSGSDDVYGTLIDIIRKEYGKELSASAIAELQAVNTHENDLHLSDETLNELTVCNDRKQGLRFTI